MNLQRDSDLRNTYAYDVSDAAWAAWEIRAMLAASPQHEPSAQGEPVRQADERGDMAMREWHRECDDADTILRALGLDPGACRTDGGSLKTGMILDALQARDRMLQRAAPSTPPPAVVEAVPLTDEQIDSLRGLDTAGRVRFYEHDFYVLSNFSAFSIKSQGRRFPTSEHVYHWEKFEPGTKDEQGLSVRNRILDAYSAHDAFKMAEQWKPLRRADWDDVKVGIMLGILRAKAAQHEYVRRKLLATGDRELVEDSWRDDFWGWGPNRDGKNMLGRLWMQVRSELRGIAPKAAQPNE